VSGRAERAREADSVSKPRLLRGRRVLVLRSREQQAETQRLLAALGALPVGVPLLEMLPAPDPEPLRRAWARASEYAWWLFTSSNTVEFSVPYLPRSSVHVAESAAGSPKVACMGRATAERAREAGLRVDRVPEQAGPDAFVAALEESGSLAGARLLLPRSEIAAELIPERLRARGARVDCVVAYCNRLPAGAAAQLAAALEPLPDAVLLTSASTVKRLEGLLGSQVFARLSERALFVCIGQSTQSALERSGVRRCVTAEQASSAGLVSALTRYHEAHGFS